MVACQNMPTLPNPLHPQNFNVYTVLCYCVLERCKRHYLMKKSNDSILNFRQYFLLKVGVIRQVGGHIRTGNQYPQSLLYFWGDKNTDVTILDCLLTATCCYAQKRHFRLLCSFCFRDQLKLFPLLSGQLLEVLSLQILMCNRQVFLPVWSL